MERTLKLILTYIIFSAGVLQQAQANNDGFNQNVEELKCSLKIARWHKGHFYKILSDIPGQILYLGQSTDVNDIQPLLWFPNLKESPLRALGVFASLVINPRTGKKEIDVGFYKAKTIFPNDVPPTKAWRISQTSSRYMVPVFTKKIKDLNNIEISYEKDIEPLNLNITGNLNSSYIDLKCEHLRSLETIY